MLNVIPGLSIPDAELIERFVRSAGPGGQNVAKVATAVELRFDIAHSLALPTNLRDRLLARRDRRISADGVLVIHAQRFRTQERNREDARARLSMLLQAALPVEKPRVATRPSRASVECRLRGKRARAQRKRERAARAWSQWYD